MREPLPALRCTGCGRELGRGESYWRVNGATICAGCFPDFAKGELEPFRRVRGREAAIL